MNIKGFGRKPSKLNPDTTPEFDWRKCKERKKEKFATG
jgi:hypothetical protein